MRTWSQAELDTVRTTDEVTLAVQHSNGHPGQPVIMWSVVVGDEVYVRAVRGAESPWFNRALVSARGVYEVGPVQTQVDIELTSQHEAEIDAAYRQKYARYAQNIVDTTVTTVAKAATLHLTPIR